jgi:cysteinyl-tRNA synthetase
MRDIQIHNTLSGRVEPLDPRDPGKISIYACGPTVYSRIHIGNARPYVVFMLLQRFLKHEGYDVTFASNVTDINDKIYDAAPGQSAALAADATRWYLEDTDRLGLGRPDVEPTAAETVPEQIALIEDLIEAGFAYEVEGDVYYRVARFPEYGRLSRQRLDQVEEQEPNPLKEDPRDFALWKANKPGEDTSWESPWGRGRPGWHIECSAMSEKYLGTSFEIHGGGLDLKFPHHENEIAQSRALGHGFARIWMHNGMLSMRGSEMHKSLGNDVSLEDALDRWGRETLLFFFMTGHWRKPLDYSDETLEQAGAQLETFRNVFRSSSEPVGDWAELEAALDDDFNTPEALAVMHGWRDHDLLRRAFGVFGLESIAEAEDAPAQLAELAERRREAREAKDFSGADRLRDEIAAAGWEVRDVAEPPGYRLVRRP